MCVLSLLGVWWGVECMLMWVGRGPRDQSEDDNPGRSLCGPANTGSQMGGEKRDREGEKGREREGEREQKRGPPSSRLVFASFSICFPVIQ